MPNLHPAIEAVTERIRRRSRRTRTRYLDGIARAAEREPRSALSCGNLAHGVAACAGADKHALARGAAQNIAIVSAYNDVLSAHQPLGGYPEVLKRAAREAGGVAQFAGGVPAMCDGVTQGRPGMELSLLSRDVIAQSAAIALSHDLFDGALLLGVCDKIVPGLCIAALAFGHLPAILVPAGPMPSGLPNRQKAKVREAFAQGRAGRAELLRAEQASYHSPGTCTFYGTANTNQMLMEFMGLHLPGASFVNPGTPLREALTAEAARRVLQLTRGRNYTPVGRVLDEAALVNGMVGLLATGGSTNHTIHLVAMARAAGLETDWTDFAELSAAVPLIARVYPNGDADVNHFAAAGGLPFAIRELLSAGLLHEDVQTVAGPGLSRYTREPCLDAGQLRWRPAAAQSGDTEVLRGAAEPFAADGGLRLLTGNLGRAIAKVSAVAPEHWRVEAPARVFDHADELIEAYRAGGLRCDVVCVLRFQGPRANGMPELHQLSPVLGALQNSGFAVALVTDGRMSGASGKVPAALHLDPEALCGGALAKVRDGDPILLDCAGGKLNALAPGFEQRAPARADLAAHSHGMGRELFAGTRARIGSAERGASTLFGDGAADA